MANKPRKVKCVRDGGVGEVSRMGGNFIAETGKVLDKPGWVGHL